MGGAIYAENGSIINIYDSIFHFNFVNSSFFDIELVVAAGGALYAAHNCSISINESSFSRNEVYAGYKIGGGLTIYRSSLVVERSKFSENKASFGGFAFLLESTAAIEQSTLDSCYVERDGAVLFLLYSNVTLQNNNATGNYAGDSGGVIYLDNSQIKIQKCNLSKNIAHI